MAPVKIGAQVDLRWNDWVLVAKVKRNWFHLSNTGWAAPNCTPFCCKLRLNMNHRNDTG